MQIEMFLRELVFFFPFKTKRTDEDTTKLLNAYKEDILRELNSNFKEYICDYQKLLQLIRTNYDYKEFPPFKVIKKFIPWAVKFEEKLSGKEGTVIKKKVRGFEYEFVVVPEHWQKVKFESQINSEIAKMKEKGN